MAFNSIVPQICMQIASNSMFHTLRCSNHKISRGLGSCNIKSPDFSSDLEKNKFNYKSSFNKITQRAIDILDGVDNKP